MLTEVQIINAQLAAQDPEHMLRGEPVPALTVLLHKVCDNDAAKFAEACRLIDLIVAKVLEKEHESNLSSN